MALLAILTKAAYGTLPDLLKKEYKDIGDGEHYELDVSPTEVEIGGKKRTYALEDVGGLKSALQKERTDNQAKDTKLKDYEGLDPKAAREAIKRLKEISEDPTTDEKVKVKVDSMIKQISEKHAGEIKTYADSNSLLEREIETLLVDNAIAGALQKHKLVDGGAELITPKLKQQVKVVKLDGGRRAARVIDENGQERVSMKKGNNGPMDIDELVELTSKSKIGKVVFAGSGASGSEKDEGSGTRQSGSTQPRGEPGGNGDGSEGSGSGGRGINRARPSAAQALIDARAKESSKGK